MWKCYEPDVRIGLSMLRIGLCEHLGRRKVWGQTRREKKRCDDDCPEAEKKRSRKILTTKTLSTKLTFFERRGNEIKRRGTHIRSGQVERNVRPIKGSDIG